MLRTVTACFILLITCACGSEPVPQDDSTAATAISGGFAVGKELQTTASVDQRSAPSRTAAVLQRIPAGTTVLSGAAHPVAGWYGITWNGRTGWVDGQYLQVSPGPANGFSRQQVYDLVAPHLQGGNGGSASDLLDSSLTTQELVNAMGWLATHAPPSWGFSVINTGHHYDPEAHSGGFAIDIFANDPADDLRFVDLVNQDPWFVEIGVSGSYADKQDRVTSASKCSFIEDAPTHVHAAVRRAFC